MIEEENAAILASDASFQRVGAAVHVHEGPKIKTTEPDRIERDRFFPSGQYFLLSTGGVQVIGVNNP